MIYQQGRLFVGDPFTGFGSTMLVGNYISIKDNWLTGILTYDQTDRIICFFPSRWPKKEGKSKIKQAKPLTENKEIPIKSLFFNIDKTNFELIRVPTFSINYRLVLITTENNEKYMFNSDISVDIRGSVTKVGVYRTQKQFVFNDSIVKVINYLKSK